MNYSNLLGGMLLAGVVVFAGCLSPKEDTKAALDAAMDDELPSTLVSKKGKSGVSLLAKAKEAENADVISSPLQKQLEQLKKEAAEQRQALSQSQTRSEELQRRSRELRSSLQSTEAKIAKVEKVMMMINENPASLDKVPLNAGSTLAMAGDGSENVKNSFNLNDDEMPALGDGPDTKEVKNEWALDNGGKGGSLAPAFDAPSLPIAAKEGDVWAAPAPKAPQSVKVILCDGEGAGANYIISKPAGVEMEKGMLFKAANESVLVVTDVYAANAKARLHPGHNKGEIKAEDSLVAINALP